MSRPQRIVDPTRFVFALDCPELVDDYVAFARPCLSLLLASDKRNQISVLRRKL
jgi:hypothetical protein